MEVWWGEGSHQSIEELLKEKNQVEIVATIATVKTLLLL